MVGVGAFNTVPEVGGPESIRIGPSVTTGPPPETIISPLPLQPLQQSWCRPNQGRSGNDQQQPHMTNKTPAIVNEVKRARNMRWVPLSCNGPNGPVD
jgi:hypothetical protein